ncbi:lycopene beta-cyclase CrtY [Sphingomicrobium nitratireducens]|uniref:lycopene beta-cyclase CrtY n=1 Tax=Sphingomicrobium nitratireducens TaxID=2964666 RepID=UPI002240D9C2|nr:lycopene beta-cyclase CrtY [Sphingomicrobium nitratireducens]
MAGGHDLIILGGGLAGSLAALALRDRKSDLDVLLVEQGEALGGNHVWSFFDSDVAQEDRAWLDPLVVRHWNGNEVRFPHRTRRLSSGYNSITSERLDSVVRTALGADAVLRGEVREAGPGHVVLADGKRLEAKAVLDARGLDKPPEGIACGYQKFLGRMLVIEGGHGVERPVIMDADVDQSDGYRFVYLLPFDETHLFVEDTYYHDRPELDAAALGRRLDLYAAAKGWKVDAIEREETGVLPVVKSGDFDALWPDSDPLARAGVRAGLFHHLTSYSLPDAVRFASWLTQRMPVGGEALGKAARAMARAHWRRSGFERVLARMLLGAADPGDRYRILERFYGLEEGLIARFYAGRSSIMDRFRILAGKPPVPIGRAIGAILERE